MTFVTEEFVGLAEITAKSLGYESFPTVRIPHPFADFSEGALRRLADERFDEVVAKLTGAA